MHGTNESGLRPAHRLLLSFEFGLHRRVLGVAAYACFANIAQVALNQIARSSDDVYLRCRVHSSSFSPSYELAEVERWMVSLDELARGFGSACKNELSRWHKARRRAPTVFSDRSHCSIFMSRRKE
ncbi:MAG: hypothetical protein JWQ87_2060 [Candidatus Sulfotelmatobacter sp.]|nr:hypothetical protein [Candidatus Sulfotelmatobacter sp.]